MDFHILTKKQAECLTQIATRESVSSFFEPLRVVRELESLRLITMEPSDQFDSGFAYSLSGLSKALTPFCAGTKYSLVPLANDHTAIFVHYNPATDGDFDPEEAAKDKARLERSNKNLAEAVQRLESDLQVVKAQNQSLENIRASLQRQRDEALNERDQTNEALEIVRRDRNGILAALREKTEVIAQLQRTVDDYAQRNKVDMATIRELQQYRYQLPVATWVGTFGDKRLVEGFYVFRDTHGEKPAYVLGTVTPHNDSNIAFWCRDGAGEPINLNVFTQAMRIDQ